MRQGRILGTQSSSTPSKIAVVTGGNRGLGYALVKSLCQILGPSAIVYLGARDAARGEQAIAKLASEGLKPRLLQLDISDDDSVAAAANLVREGHDGVDIVIGNAAMMPRREDQAAQVDAFIDTNNFGANRLIKAFGPLLNDGARFLIISSMNGVKYGTKPLTKAAPEQIAALNRQKRERLFDEKSVTISSENLERFIGTNATLGTIESALRDFCISVKRGTLAQDGWPDWMNRVSKFGQIASIILFAREMAEEAARRDILINAACPGFVDTEASREAELDVSLALSPMEAAEHLMWIVTRPPGSTAPYGQMVSGRKVLDLF